MKKSLDERLHEEMNREQEIPDIVQKAFNRSYTEIRSKSKKKTKKTLVEAYFSCGSMCSARFGCDFV